MFVTFLWYLFWCNYLNMRSLCHFFNLILVLILLFFKNCTRIFLFRLILFSLESLFLFSFHIRAGNSDTKIILLIFWLFLLLFSDYFYFIFDLMYFLFNYQFFTFLIVQIFLEWLNYCLCLIKFVLHCHFKLFSFLIQLPEFLKNNWL